MDNRLRRSTALSLAGLIAVSPVVVPLSALAQVTPDTPGLLAQLMAKGTSGLQASNNHKRVSQDVSAQKAHISQLEDALKKVHADNLILSQQMKSLTKQVNELISISGKPPQRTTVTQHIAQNLTVAVTDPLNQPIPGLSLTAKIWSTDSQNNAVIVQTLTDLHTDAKGNFFLPKIPLPARVEIAFAPQAGVRADQAEWVFHEATDSFLALTSQSGVVKERKVVTLNEPPPARFAGRAHGLRSFGQCYDPQQTKTQSKAKTVPKANETIVYEAVWPKTIVLDRTVADVQITAPMGSKVTSSALPPEGITLANGTETIKMPVGATEHGPVDIVVTQDCAGGEREASLEIPKLDPYKPSSLTLDESQLRLVHLKNLNVVAANVDVLDKGDKILDALGEPGKKRLLSDGSVLWEYSERGLAIKMRYLPPITPPLPALPTDPVGKKDKKGKKKGTDPVPDPPAPTVKFSPEEAKADELIVEAIRVIGKNGGDIGQVTVGSDIQQANRAFGPPQLVEDKRHVEAEAQNGSTITYCDRGLRIHSTGTTIDWLEIGRKKDVLLEGTTAFTPGNVTRVFVQDFQGDPNCDIATKDDFVAYLNSIGVIKVVDQQVNADFVLSAQVKSAEKTDAAHDLIPNGAQRPAGTTSTYSRYDYDTSLDFTLRTAQTNELVTQNVEHGLAYADYTAEVPKGSQNLEAWRYSLVVLDLITNGKFLQSIPRPIALLGQIAIDKYVNDEKNKAQRNLKTFDLLMTQARKRCRGIALRSALAETMQDIGTHSGFLARVVDIDYDRGIVQLNVGTKQGVHTAEDGKPTEFDIRIKNRGLSARQSGFLADYYTAVVTDAEENTCTCKMVHVVRSVSNSAEQTTLTPAPEAAKMLPCPATCVVWARAMARYQEVPTTATE